MFFSHQKETPPRRQVISMVFVSVLFGFSAGAVGMLVAAAYLTPEPQLLNLGGLPYLRERAAIPERVQEHIASPVENAAKSLVLFYPAKTLDRDRVAGREVFLSAETVGAGMVLTSDGWLITHSDLLSARGIKNAADLSAVVNSRRYPVKETVRDPYTGLMFVKIEAVNLPVVSFGSDAALVPGDSVFAFDAARGPRRFDVIGIGDRPLSVLGDAVRSSEKLHKVLRLAEADAVLAGSMLLDREGEVVGIFVGSSAVGSTAVPFSAFSGIIGSVLKDKTANRPFLGVNYLALADNRPGAMKGALLISTVDGRRPAVLRQSPAARAGLRDGDIILTVNGEDVTANNALADIIAAYEAGGSVTITFERRDEENTVELILGAASIP